MCGVSNKIQSWCEVVNDSDQNECNENANVMVDE